MDGTESIFSISLVFIFCLLPSSNEHIMPLYLVKYSQLLGMFLNGLIQKRAKGGSGHRLPLPQACPHQGALQVEGLGVLAQQHDVLLQVIETAVLVVADALLWVVGEAALPQDPTLCLGTLGVGVPLPNKVTTESPAPLYRLGAQTH